jgi:hypothetical protein
MKKLLIFVLAVVSLGVAQQQTGGSLTAQGATCATSGACISLHFEFNDVASASIQLSGTFTATVQFEASSDGGATWVAISGTPLNSSTAVSSATTANTWKFNVASLTDIRARCSAFTSAPTVVIRSSKAVANAIGGGAVYASGLGTSNVIPKGNGAGQLADSALTDNATTVTSSEFVIVPSTNSATVAGGIGGATNEGINFNGTSHIQFINAGARQAAISTTALTVSKDFPIGWSNTTSDALGSAFDTNLSRESAGIARVGTTAGNSAGTLDAATFQYRGLAQTYFVTSDFTTSASGTALEAITGLTWTFPASTAINARVDCNILYNQNAGTAAVAFGWQDATIAPTNLAASGFMYTSATASTEGTVAASTATTAVSLVSATPSVITTIWHAQLHFLIEQPSNASTSVFTIRVSTATAADTVTVKRGSYCSLAQ